MYDQDQLEYAISQYLDGTLPPLERTILERRLSEDVEARELLDAYRRLDRVLKGMPMPAVRWDRLADHLAQAVAREEPPVRHYSIEWVRWTSRAAVAASLMLAAGIGLVAYLWDTTPGPGEPGLVMVGPPAETPRGPVVESVTVGPPAATAEASWPHAEEVITRPTRIIVAAAQDIGPERRRIIQ
jgi:anti-sigma factor RsiW